MSILVIRHEPFEHLGYFADVLKSKGIDAVNQDMGQPIDLAAHSGLVLMGGPQSANDALPPLAAEMYAVRTAVNTSKAVLGICLGSQLIAKALGARVYPNPVKEIGWAPVAFTEVARKDALFKTFESPTHFFHWHGETFDLPDGAEWLAYTTACRHQAYRVNKSVYGIQFHPEITPEMIVDWSQQSVNCGDVETLEAPINPHAFDTKDHASRIMEAWIRLTR